MSMSLGKGLMIAAGIGAVGIGGYMLLKGDKGEEQVGEGGEKDPAAGDPLAGGDPAAMGPPTGTTMAPTPGIDPTAGATASSPMPGSGMPGGGTMPATGTSAMPGAGGLQGEQIGPYTVVPDPQSGMQIVFETATQQPVGVVDAQGNITPITVDAQGNVQLAQDPSTASALGARTTGPAPHPGVAGPGAAMTAPGTTATDAERGAVYNQIATELFANASDPTIGSATSDSMSGATSLAPSTGTSAGAATGGGVRTRQAGEYTLVEDGSGVTVVLDTASQQPVAMMDQSGNVTPITVDAQGNVSVAGASPAATAPAAGAMPTAGASVPTTPSMVGAAVPGM